ncbi:MAG: lasso peptide biosynthesis B2 protein [Polyangiaceae bacterium]
MSTELGERLVAVAYRAHLLRGTCRPRSLVQYLLHRRDGTPARFVVGVRRPAANDGGPSRIEAHAWVEGAETAPAAADAFSPIFESGRAPET